MPVDISISLDKLTWFQKKVGINDEEMAMLRKYRHLFIEKKDLFSKHFFDYFSGIPETKFFLEHEEQRGRLQEAWARWFGSLFEQELSDPFLQYLWKSGLRHVEINIDHRFITLGYSVIRQFCHEIVKREVPSDDQESLLSCIDKMVDYCQLVETCAYIEATTRCDMEVVRGISHQVRNPLTVIGGHILRLKREVDEQSPVFGIYETILGENKRLESMVKDAAVYSEMFQRPATPEELSIEDLISQSLKKLEDTPAFKNVQIEMDPDSPLSRVKGDPDDLEMMLDRVLKNSLEFADPKAPFIRITSRRRSSDSPFLDLEIFNNGQPPSQEDLEHLFVPFFSSKPYGTGFGLPIAQLAARRSLGELTIEPVPGKGTLCRIKLPLAVE